jgi:hypothetical protein
MKPRHLLLAVVPFLFTSCTSTTAYRQKNGSLTVTQSGWNAVYETYWITGAGPGRITAAENLTVFRRSRQIKSTAVPVKCSGFVDATEAKHIEIRLAEKRGGQLSLAWANGRHKLVDESAPKPFYHWLIP